MERETPESLVGQRSPTGRRIVGLKELAALFDISKERATQISKFPDFPATLCEQAGQAELAGGRIYFEDEILEWAKTWKRRPGTPR